MFGPVDVAQSYRSRHRLRGSMLPSVDLVQDVGQHEVPLAPPARSGCYATQHVLLDGADGALREVGVAPDHLLLDVPEIHQLLELPLELGAASECGRAGLRDLDCTCAATSGGVSMGSVVRGDVTSSGTVSAQLFTSNTLTVTNTSDFSDDLTLTKNWAGWSKLQISNNSAARSCGCWATRARGSSWSGTGAHQCELIMINDEALAQTKSLLTQLSLAEPGLPATRATWDSRVNSTLWRPSSTGAPT